MRLGIYIPILDERPAGVGVYIEEICSRLIARNPDFVVFTGTPEAKRDWLDPVRVRSFGTSDFFCSSWMAGGRRRARRLRWLVNDARKALVDERIDILFSPVQEAPLVGLVPSVMVMHDLTALKFPEAYGLMTVAQTRWLVPRMLRRAAAIVAVSQNTKSDLIKTFNLNASKIQVIGEGYDRQVFRPRSVEEIAAASIRSGLGGRYLLYAGTFSRHKNLSLIARAMVSMGDEFGDVTLVLVGRKDAGAFAEFQLIIRGLGIAERVVTPGYVTRDDLAALMSGASAFVYPSRYEGFGLAPLEAMACGAVVVASDVASLPEVIGEGGILVRSNDPNDWAEALRHAILMPRDAASSAAIKQARLFDWDEAANAILTNLQRLALRRPQ